MSIMGNTTRSRRIPAVLMACMAAITFIAATACSSESTPDASTRNVTELQKRGFTDVTALETTARDGIGAYYATAGNCRFKVWYLVNPTEGNLKSGLRQGFTLMEDSSRGEDNNLRIFEPSLAKVKQHEALKYCFTTPPTTQSVAPAG